MGIKKTIVGAGLASTALASAIEKRATLAFTPTVITSCTVPGTVALTFDDGPYLYTQKIVDALTANGHKATFFQNGMNYDSIYNYGSVLQSMLAGGHQIGSHTWSHADLATLDAAGIKSQMDQLEQAHLALIGKAPQYLRPPYLSTNDLVLSTLTELKYHVVSVDIDTQDYAEGPAGRIQNSIDWYKGNLTAGGSLSLMHDVYTTTADTLVPAVISYLDSIGKKSVTVGTCLGDDEANWYRGGSVSPSASASAVASASASVAASAAASAAASGSAKASGAPAPSGTGSATKPSGAPAASKAPELGRPPSGGDTEPGHGPDAGRGAMPGKKGSGNDGWSGPASGSGSGSYPAAGASSSSSGSGSSSGNGTSAAQPSSVYTGPYSNGASTLTGSALALAAAAVVALCL